MEASDSDSYVPDGGGFAIFDEETQDYYFDENSWAKVFPDEKSAALFIREFPQEQELTEKTSQLNVLRITLNMDGKSNGKRERDKEELDGGKPSIKGMLKRLGVESSATASTPQKGKDMEVAI